MKKELCDKFTQLLGHKTWKKVGEPCTGKWRGTTDYFLVFEDNTRVFISNGMTFFDENLQREISNFERFTSPDFQKKMMDVLNEQREVDNEIAKREGLLPYSILGFVYKQRLGGITYGLKLKVDDRTFDFVETGLVMDMLEFPIGKEALLKGWMRKPLFTAGAVENPTFIFHNVRFSHVDKLYKF